MNWSVANRGTRSHFVCSWKCDKEILISGPGPKVRRMKTNPCKKENLAQTLGLVFRRRPTQVGGKEPTRRESELNNQHESLLQNVN